MKVVSTKIPDDVYKSLREVAQKQGVSVSELLRRIVYEILGKPNVYQGSTTNLRKEMEDLRIKLRELEKRIEELERGIKKLSGVMFWVDRR